jgi:DNA-binding XRE family transcriptional regulator
MKIAPNSSVGAALRQARLELGMTQEHLADVLGISASRMNRVEHGALGGGLDTDWIALMPLDICQAVKAALAREVAMIPISRDEAGQRRAG